MSWWFPRFNLFGEIASGNGRLWVHGDDRGPGYSPDWISADFLIVPSPDAGGKTAIMQQVSGQREELPWAFSPRVGNAPGVSGGQGSWCGWSEVEGLIFNGVSIDPTAAPGSIDRLTGHLSYLSPYQSTLRRVVVDGRVIRQGAPAVDIRAADGASLWSEFDNGRWKLWGCIGKGQALARGPLPLEEPEFAGIPVLVDDVFWIVLQTSGGIVCYPWGSHMGYIVDDEEWRFPDAIAVANGRIRVRGTNAQGTALDHTFNLGDPMEDLSHYHPSDGGQVPEQPRVTITDFNPKQGEVPPELAVKAVCQVTGGPADRLIWSQQKDGGSWQVVAPNNAPDDPDHTYRFNQPGTYGLKVKVEGPGGSDETGVPRVVSVIQKDQTLPIRNNRYIFGPNIGSNDMLRLFNEPDSWKDVRVKLDVFQFYLQHILDVGGDIGPNSYQAFKDAGAFKMLREWGIPIMVEQGSVKPGACDAKGPANMMKEAQQRIADAGGVLSSIAMDEPLVSGLDPTLCNQAMAQCAEATAFFIREGQSLGLSVGWIEAWPHSSVDQMAEFLQELDKRGGRPAFWHLDIDRKRAQSEGKSIRLMLEQCAQHAADRSIPLGVIFVGYAHETDAEYCTDVRAWINEVHGYQPGLGQVKVQSWATRGEGGHQDIPLNCPESENDKHTSLLADAIVRFS